MSEELSGVILIVAAIYLGAVVGHGNTGQLVNELAKEKGFGPWLLSLVIVYWLWKSESAGPVIASIAGLGLLATLFVLFGSSDFVTALNNLLSPSRQQHGATGSW